MTQILTASHDFNYVVQVSDRRITRGPVPFDEVAPKTVIASLRDAIVCIGYTGLAYLEGIPTDQWIAQKVWGEPLYSVDFVSKNRRHPNLSHLGSLILRIKADLTVATAHSSTLMKLHIAGWQIMDNGHTRQTSTILLKMPSSPEWTISRQSRHAPRGLYVVETGGHVLPQDKEEALNQLQDDRLRDATYVADLLAKIIRNCASRSPNVGDELLAVIIPRHCDPIVVAPSNGNRPGAPTFFSPWIVGQKTILGSSEIFNTSMQVTIDGLKFSIAPSLSDEGLVSDDQSEPDDDSDDVRPSSFVGPNKRPPEPKR